MKKMNMLFVLAPLLLIANSSFAVESQQSRCNLEKPIRLSGENISLPIHLKNVHTNEFVKFYSPDGVSSSSELVVDIFNVSQDDRITPYLGIRLSRHQKYGSIGSANYYGGNMINLSGGLIVNEDGTKVYTLTSLHTHKIDGKELISDSTVSLYIQDNQIKAIYIKNPVYQFLEENPANVYRVRFTGEHQDIWVCSAEM